jgi:hypothetical protein
MDPTMTGRTRADFAVDLLLADPMFYTAQQTQTIPYNTPTVVNNQGQDYVGLGYARPFTLAFTSNPTTDVTLTNSTVGCSVTISGTYSASYVATLDVLAYTALGSDNANLVGKVTHTGTRPWMMLAPGNNTLTLTSSGISDAGSCLITWSAPWF